MKRILRWLAVTVGVVLIAVVVLLVVAFSGRQAITDGFELIGVRIIKDGMVSVAMIQFATDAVALIDAGKDPSGKPILSELARRGLSPGSVKAILVTHGHPDHVAAVPLFPNAEVMALDQEAGIVEGRAGSRGPLTRLLPVRPTGIRVGRILRDGETIALGPVTARVYAVPGHTAGSAAFLVNRILFLGDSADATSDGHVQGAAWSVTDDTGENRRSLSGLVDRLRQDGAQVDALAFAHSGVLKGGLEPLAAFARQR